MNIPISVGSGPQEGKVADEKMDRKTDPFKISAARFGTSNNEHESIDVLREVISKIRHSGISFRVGNFRVPSPKPIKGVQPDVRRLFITYSMEGRCNNAFAATAEGKTVNLP